MPACIAEYWGSCPACNNPIAPGSRVYLRRGQWVHETCMPGGDDEEPIRYRRRSPRKPRQNP